MAEEACKFLRNDDDLCSVVASFGAWAQEQAAETSPALAKHWAEHGISVEAAIRKNGAARQAARQVIRALADVPSRGVPVDGPTCLTAFLAACRTHTEDTSFLSTALRLRDSLNELASVPAIVHLTEHKTDLAVMLHLDAPAESEDDTAEPRMKLQDALDVTQIVFRLSDGIGDLRGLLVDTFKAAVDRAFTSMEVTDCLEPGSFAAIEGLKVDAQLKLLLGSAGLKANTVLIGKAYAAEISQREPLPWERLFSVLEKLSGMFEEESTSVTLTSEKFFSTEEEVTLNLLDELPFMKALIATQTLVAHLHYLRSMRDTAPAALIENNALRSPIERVIAAAGCQANRLTQFVQEVAVVPPTDRAPWRTHVAHLQLWARCVQEVIQNFKRHFVQVLLQYANGVIEEMGDIPNTAIIVNDSSYDRQAAKRRLLDWPGRTALAVRSKTLYLIMKNLQGLYANAFSLGTRVDEDAVFADGVKVLKNVFEQVKNVNVLIQHLDVIQNMAGAVQVTNAENLLTKANKVPKTVLNALERIVEKGKKRKRS